MARGIGRPMAVLVLSDEERSYLERQARRRRVARSLSDRCRMILRCADGLTNKAVAIELGVHEHTVGKWRRRFLKERIEGLSDEPRPGRPRTLTDDQVAKVVERTLSATPADATHWSLRSMARESGLSHTTIWRIPCIFLGGLHRAERAIAGRLLGIAAGNLPWPDIDPGKALPWVERKTGLALASGQADAVRAALSSKVSVITGGPGVGNLTPADVYFGRDKAIIKRRKSIKKQTIEKRRLAHQRHAA